MSERLVHVCNGDATADQLSLADLPGDIRVWADALDLGPVLPVDDAEFYKQRAAYWGVDSVPGWDKGFDDAAKAEELVLWFEHDLFDQFALVRLLARLARRGQTTNVTIVSIDRHPEVPTFLGLGQLSPEQLAQLWPNRVALSRDAIEEAQATWVALTANDPRALVFLMRRVRALPFLAGAIERHLEELPDPTSGLSRTERQLLAAIARGETDPRAAIQAIDPRYTITDVVYGKALASLRAATLLEGDAITAAGRAALAGAIDRVAEHGIDTWRGGVHLSGRGPVWRWDSRERKLFEK